MNILKGISVALALLATSACAGLPPPKPLDSQSTAIGISVTFKGPTRLSSNGPERIYFVKVERAGDLYRQRQYMPSNYVKGDRAYLLNAPPGRYVAVAAFKRSTTQQGGTKEFTTLFSKELIKLTEVTTAPGTIGFMGEHEVRQSTLTDTDDAQLHYAGLIAPHAVSKSGVTAQILRTMFSSEEFYKGTLVEAKRDKRSEEQFLAKAMKDLRKGGWSAMIQQRLDLLRASQ